MTALDGILGHLPHRWAAGKAVGNLSAAARALSKSEAPLLSGKPVRFRTVQSAIWSVVAGLVGAAFTSGLYDAIFQIHWYIHIYSVHVELFYLKRWWDDGMGFIHSRSWPLYRHTAFRDLPAPAFATMAVQTMLAKRKWWGVRVSALRVATAPLGVIALTFGLGVLGVWLLDFGGPAAWHYFFPGTVLPGTKWLGDVSAGELILGYIIGRILHRYWAPVGATLQGYQLDRSVDRWQGKILKAGITVDQAVRLNNAGLRILPVWERRPIAPPVIRERFAEMWRNNETVSFRDGRSRSAAVAFKVAVSAVTLISVLTVLLGFVGHYWAGTGHTVPYLFPGGG